MICTKAKQRRATYIYKSKQMRWEGRGLGTRGRNGKHQEEIWWRENRKQEEAEKVQIKENKWGQKINKQTKGDNKGNRGKGKGI